MYANIAYLNNSIEAFCDTSAPLIVGSCGHYRFSGEDLFHTCRPEGRVDYQLLYIASGKTFFTVGGVTQTLPAGNMVLYRPGESQDYIYYGEDQPEIYWVHFTGSEVDSLLLGYGISEPVFCCGSSALYGQLFYQMIGELQRGCTCFEELLAMYLRQIFVEVRRSGETENVVRESAVQEEMSRALEYFHRHYMEDISIAGYAQSRGMSVSWFLRCFKNHTHRSPMQYITALRINQAINLLMNTSCNITQIAAMVGYENPLYFSRIFRKTKGVSPSQYRKMTLSHEK